MSEERPVNLHFFTNDNFVKFSKVCNKQGVGYQVRQENGEWHVTTKPLTPTDRRKLISAWADASIERINE
jgi:hypothetical protein